MGLPSACSLISMKPDSSSKPSLLKADRTIKVLGEFTLLAVNAIVNDSDVG